MVNNLFPCGHNVIYNGAMTNEHDTSSPNDWNKLAQEALDLWQTHLTSLSTDPKAKEEMAKFISPMGQMFAQWSGLMQGSLQSTAPRDEAPASDQSPQTTMPDVADAKPDTPEEAGLATTNAWQEEIIRAAQAAVKTVNETTAILAKIPSAPTIAETPAATMSIQPAPSLLAGEQMMAAYAAMVDVSELASPVYGSNTGASFSSIRNNMTEDAKATQAEATVLVDAAPVAAAFTQEDSADAKSDVLATAAAPAGGSTPVASGPRDLAELANRLAQLERELDGLRAKNKRGDATDTNAALDDADDQDAQRMARARQGSASF